MREDGSTIAGRDGAERPFEATFEQAPIGLAHVAPDGTWLRVNPRLCGILGYSREELVRLTFQDITHPDDLAADVAQVRRMLAGEIARYDMEKRYVRRDGSLIWGRLTVSLVRDEATGEPQYFISAIEDIDARRRAEQAHREAEERFQSLVNGVREYALFLFDADGIITSWNPGVQRVLGWEEREIVGHHIRVIYTPEDQAAGVPEQEMERAAREGMSPDERWHIKKDGTRFYAIGTVHSLRDDAGGVRGYTKVLGDFTARYQTEERLQRKDALIDLSWDAIFAQEPDTNRVIFWGRGAEETYGWTRAEAEGCVVSDLLQTRFSIPREEILRELETSGRWEGDLIHTRKDGRRVTVASRWALQREPSTGQALAVLEVNRDVTEERRLAAERADYVAQQERIAETLQRSLLMAPPPDIFPGLTVKALYQGAQDDVLVGGDFFDIYAVAEDLIALVVGDATGKGLEAATYTAEIKFALRAFLREYPSPAVALGRLNAFVADKDRLDPYHLGQSYVALAVALVDTRTGDLSAAMAGMEMPFLLRAGGEAVMFEASGPLLGVSEDTDYTGQQDVLAEGDVLVISTDGLTEARHPARRRDFFGVDGLLRAARVETARHPSLAEVSRAVLQRAREFAGGAINDDVCLLMARRRPREA